MSKTKTEMRRQYARAIDKAEREYAKAISEAERMYDEAIVEAKARLVYDEALARADK